MLSTRATGGVLGGIALGLRAAHPRGGSGSGPRGADAAAGDGHGARARSFVSVENLTNTEWPEAQFYFASRLQGEPAEGVVDIQFTSRTPRAVLGGISWRF
jgi:hypothetical protein